MISSGETLYIALYTHVSSGSNVPELLVSPEFGGSFESPPNNGSLSTKFSNMNEPSLLTVKVYSIIPQPEPPLISSDSPVLISAIFGWQALRSVIVGSSSRTLLSSERSLTILPISPKTLALTLAWFSTYPVILSSWVGM